MYCYGLAHTLRENLIRVYAITELRSPQTVSQKEKMCMYAKENLRSPEDLGNKKLSFSKDGVSVHVLPISFFKFRIILFVSFIVSGKPSLQSPTVKRS